MPFASFAFCGQHPRIHTNRKGTASVVPFDLGSGSNAALKAPRPWMCISSN